NPLLPQLPASSHARGTQSCADFSGVWLGSCKVTGDTPQSFDDAMRVQEDDCGGVLLGWTPFTAGGTLRVGAALPGSAIGDEDVVLSVDWNDARDHLQFSKHG